MFSFEELILYFFPERSDQEREVLVQKLENGCVNYVARDWSHIDLLNLSEEKVQLNLLYSLYQYQFSYYDGVDMEILGSLEDWSDKKIYFDILTDEQNWFYEKYYALLGFINFEYQKQFRQEFLLNSRFLVFAVLSGFIDVSKNVRNYFSHYCSINILKQDADTFADAIAENKNIVGDLNDKENKTIAAWVKLLNEFKAENNNKVEEFFEKFVQITSLPDPLKYALHQILSLYNSLITNNIWKNITEDHCLHEEKVESQKSIDREAAYLDFLKKLPNLVKWLGNAELVVNWLKTQSSDFTKKLLLAVKDKVDLEDDNQLQLLLQFGSILHEQKLIFDDLVYFNESDNKFHWSQWLTE
ncbi:MAG: hypothetical protein ACD_5C00151G0002 [uncultured bacterium]|nr:MAG: hypothetical protein ACD_5C00151G0002 [uncultured bacterium]